MIWRRSLLLTVLAITGLAIETSVLGTATLAGTKPELLLLVTVAIAIGEGPAFGATGGFTLGMATDLLLQRPAGLSALTYLLIGYAVGQIRAQVQQPSAWLPIVMVSLSTVVGVLFYGALTFLLGGALSVPRLFRNAGLAAAYSALLTPFVYPVVRNLARRLRPVGVTP